MTETIDTGLHRLALLSQAPRFIKQADSDAEFEQALADMAYTQLASRAPKLFRYAVAFQLVDQSDDKKQAVGVFVFRAGKSWAQVPVFYRNGEIRGTEILILGPDDFFPLSEEAVNNYLASRADGAAGSPVSKGETARYSAPNLWQLNTPPTKWASARLPADELAALARARKAPATFGGPELLTSALCRAPKLAAALGKLVKRYPLFGETVADLLDRAKLAAAAAELKTQAKPTAGPALLRAPVPKPPVVPGLAGPKPAVKKAALRVVRVTQTSLTVLPVVSGMGLSPDIREKLLAGENAYDDKREEHQVTHVVDWGMIGDGDQATNPGAGSDVYAVVGADGDAVECVVMSAPVAPGDRNDDFVLVLKLSDKSYALVPRGDVWVTGRAPARFKEWFDDLPEAPEPAKLPKRFVLVDPKGAVSAPLYNNGPVSGLAGIEVHPESPDHGSPYWFSPSHKAKPLGNPLWDPTGDTVATVPDHYDHRNRLDEGRPRMVARTPGPAGKFVLTGRTLYYPVGTKIVELPTRNKALPLGGWDAGQDPLAYRAKRAADQAGAKPLQIVPHGEGGFEAAGNGRVTKAAGRTDLEADLVEVFGLSVPDAVKLSKYAAQRGGAVVRVKYAAAAFPAQAVGEQTATAPPFPFEPDQAQGGGFADEIVPSVHGQQAAVDVQSVRPSVDDYQRYRAWPVEHGMQVDVPGIQQQNPAADAPDPSGDPELLKFLSSAAQSGSKEVAATGMLGALLQIEDDETVLAELLPSMRKTITKCGRTLCHMYAHMDDYEERYGRIEAGTILDQLRANFTNLGKLYLALREKASDRVVSSQSVLPDMTGDDTGPGTL